MVHIDLPLQSKEMADFLVTVQEQGTPLRVDSETETYYVLTAKQLMYLLQSIPDDAAQEYDLVDESSFALEDFGLTEADVAAYEARQQTQKRAINPQHQQPLNANLQRRLEALPKLEKLDPQRAVEERAKLLAELESAMLHNLHAIISET
ncbi:MAG: hypothetical protein R2911_27535 [Caldilineaceae bacterium]